jgi:hypothetical protein
MSSYSKPPYNVIIYAGGKVGGCTLNKTFRFNKGFNPIHIHSNRCFKNSQKIGIGHFIKNENPHEIFDLINKKKTYFIDVYRNSIDRKISAYFQNLSHNRKFFKVPENISIDEEVDFFHLKIFHNLENYEGLNEVLENYKIDKLDYKGKYWYLEKDNKIFIRLKFSLIKEWGDILTEIFQKPIKIINSNLTKEKDYNSDYEKFKKIYFERYK